MDLPDNSSPFAISGNILVHWQLMGPSGANGTNGSVPPEVSQPRYPITMQCILGSLMVLMIILSVCGNGLVCYLVYHNEAMRSAINLLLSSMAISDALLGTLCMPLDFLTLVLSEWVLGEATQQIHAFFFGLLSLATVLILVVISADRFVILVKRRDKLSSKNAKIMIGVCWAVAVLCNVPTLAGWPGFLPFSGQTHALLAFPETSWQVLYSCILFSVGYFLPVFAMLFCYSNIICRVRRDAVRVSVQWSSSSETSPGPQPPPPNGLTLALPDPVGSTAKRHSVVSLARSKIVFVDMRFKTRTLATILIIFLLFCVFQTPYVIYNFVCNLTGRPPSTAFPYLMWWCYLNPSINPLVYAWRIRKFRVACLEMFPGFATCFRPCLTQSPGLRSRPSTIYKLKEPSYFSHENGQPVMLNWGHSKSMQF